MDMQTIVLALVALAGIALAGVGIYVARKPTSVATFLEELSGGLTDIERAAATAREYVLAAEQLWQSGQLSKDSRLGFVLDRLGAVFPEIPAETLRDSVEAAVAWMKMGEGKLTNEN